MTASSSRRPGLARPCTWRARESPVGHPVPVPLDLASDAARAFLAERHLATLTTLRPDGSPHVVAVGFTWDPAAGLARVITFAHSRKARNLAVSLGSRA